MRSRASVLAGLLAVLVLAAGAGLFARDAHGSGPLETAFLPAESFMDDDGLTLRRVRASGASTLRLFLHWRNVAPAGPRTKAPGLQRSQS